MMLPELHIYPIVTAILFPATFFLTYLISVLLTHTEFDWPYISDTGAYPPEACIFSQLMNVGALLVAIVVYIRYKQVHEFFISHQIGQRSIKINTIGLYLGWIGAFGISIVANFPETEVFAVHLTGALMAFGIGSVYLWVQVYSSFKLTSLTHGRWLTHLRLALATISSVSFVVMLVTGIIARRRFDGTDPTKWYPSNGGWSLHVTSTVSEWILALAYDFFLLSFVSEFKKVKLDSPKICLRIRESGILISNEDCNETEDVRDMQGPIET